VLIKLAEILVPTPPKAEFGIPLSLVVDSIQLSRNCFSALNMIAFAMQLFAAPFRNKAKIFNPF
jgi:hypothetical protein